MLEILLDNLALKICAAMDDGEPCETEPCEACRRQARAAYKFLMPPEPTLRLVDPPDQYELDV
jgi:hypothetical protein